MNPVLASMDFLRAKDFGDTFSSVCPSASRRFFTHVGNVDVQCQEVCVYCFKRFRLASEFIRHAPQHHDDGSVKSIFMRDMSQILRNRVATELEATQKSNKRAWKEAAVDQSISRGKKARLNDVDVRTIDSQIHLGNQMSMKQVHSYHLEGSEVQHFAPSLELEHQQTRLLGTKFSNLPATTLYPTDLGQAAQMSVELDNFDAPVYAILSGPPIWSSQTGWVQEVQGGDTLNSGEIYHHVS